MSSNSHHQWWCFDLRMTSLNHEQDWPSHVGRKSRCAALAWSKSCFWCTLFWLSGQQHQKLHHSECCWLFVPAAHLTWFCVVLPPTFKKLSQSESSCVFKLCFVWKVLLLSNWTSNFCHACSLNWNSVLNTTQSLPSHNQACSQWLGRQIENLSLQNEQPKWHIWCCCLQCMLAAVLLLLLQKVKSVCTVPMSCCVTSMVMPKPIQNQCVQCQNCIFIQKQLQFLRLWHGLCFFHWTNETNRGTWHGNILLHLFCKQKACLIAMTCKHVTKQCFKALPFCKVSWICKWQWKQK